jgi:hypothetical protein
VASPSPAVRDAARRSVSARGTPGDSAAGRRPRGGRLFGSAACTASVERDGSRILNGRNDILGASDVPAGWTVYPETPTSSATVSQSVTAPDPKCAGFLRQVEDPPDPLPPSRASVQLDGGNLRPPYVVESVEAFAAASAAAAELARQQQDVAACPQVTYTVEGSTSPVSVAAEPPPLLSIPASGVRLTAQGGGLAGYDARIVTAQVGDTLLSLTFLRATAEQRDALTAAAVAKAVKGLGTTAG